MDLPVCAPECGKDAAVGAGSQGDSPLMGTRCGTNTWTQRPARLSAESLRDIVGADPRALKCLAVETAVYSMATLDTT